MSNEWVQVGAAADFGSRIKVVEIGRRKIAIARLEGELFAFNALCPHSLGPMERAEVEGAIVTCPLHGWRFDLKAAGRELHDYRSIGVYDVRVQDGYVQVRTSGAMRSV